MTAYHLDLCSGIGGFALAARWLGMQTIGFCEIDPFCQRVLAKNFPGVPIHDDLKSITGDLVRDWTESATRGLVSDSGSVRCERRDGTPEGLQRDGRGPALVVADPPDCERFGIDLITGGYPCQPFSLAGKRLGAEDDRHLWPYIAALVADLRPRYCLFENVAGHITLGLDRVLADLEALGYTCRPVVVPACALNAPHRRDRVWLMAESNSITEREPADQTMSVRNGRAPRMEADGRGDGLPLGISGTAMADATDGGVRRGSTPREAGQPALRGEDDPDSNSTRPQGRSERLLRSRERVAWKMGAEPFSSSRQAEPGLGQSHDGFSGRLDGRLARPWDTDWEAGVPRVSDGCVDRVNKLKALGNAIVPAVAYTIMAGMMEA